MPLSRLSQRLFRPKKNNLLSFLFLFLFLSFFSCTPDELDQEYDLIPVDLPGHIHGIAFLNDSIGYVTGGDTWFSGFVGKTIDNGNSWNYDSLSPKMMMCIDLENDQGVIAGFEGLVYPLDGSDWRKQNINRNDFIRDVEIIDDTSTLVVAGLAYRFGTILKFTETGAARSVYGEEDDNPELSAIEQINDNTFIAVGYGRILRSTDKGESWIIIDQEGDFFKDVLFVDAMTGYIVGSDGLILKTSDAGLNWSKVREGGNLDQGDRLKSITVTSTGELWVCGKSGLLLISTDEGSSWSAKKLNTDSDLNKVTFHNGSIFVGGQEGLFARIKL